MRMKISISAHFSCLGCLTLMSDEKKAQGEVVVVMGDLGWHEQLLTEKQDLLVTIATLVLRTLVCLSVYSLFVQSSS